MEDIPVTVKVCDRSYKIMVKPEDEVLVREAAKRIGDRVDSYSENYAFKDRQDLLTMVALQYTSQTLRNERAQSFINNELEERMLKLEDILSL